MREELSFCRLCGSGCGMKLTIDENDRITSLRADRDDPMTRGYACFKGLNFADAHYDPNRVLRPLVRRTDGSFTPIHSEQALDAIGATLADIIDRHGPEAVAMFCGNGTVSAYNTFMMQSAFMAAIGSTQRYSTITIDQSAKFVAFERMGGWAGGAIQLETADVAMLFGSNPLVSHGATGVLSMDPVKRLKDAKARGTKLIVIDPRRTETALHADVFLQPLPGEDTAIAAAMVRLILAEGWHDAEFCARFTAADDLARLQDAVDEFTPEVVEARAGLNPGDIAAAARLFALESKRGVALTATGPNFGPHSNVSQHLVSCLNVICGRFPRAGEKVDAIDIMSPLPDFREEVIPAPRSWDNLPPSRIRGVGMIIGERLSGTLADEILTPGEGQIRALIVSGGNPLNSIPDQAKIKQALDTLELLVVVDPFMTVTAEMAHYILPPTMIYERPEMPMNFPGFPLVSVPWARYTPAMVPPPPGADLVDDWYVLWSLAKRLGKIINYCGVDLDSDRAPTADELIEIRMRPAAVPLDAIKAHPRGTVFDLGDIRVQPARPGHDSRFSLMPDDVLAELDAARTYRREDGYEFLLVSRRTRDFQNSTGFHTAGPRSRHSFNPACLAPSDMARLNLTESDVVEITSGHGTVRAVVHADASLRPGVVSLSHGFGGVIGDDSDPREAGTNINPLISDTEHVERVNAMPRMTAIPINIRPVAVSKTGALRLMASA